jgi:hypothetical protein
MVRPASTSSTPRLIARCRRSRSSSSRKSPPPTRTSASAILSSLDAEPATDKSAVARKFFERIEEQPSPLRSALPAPPPRHLRSRSAHPSHRSARWRSEGRSHRGRLGQRGQGQPRRSVAFGKRLRREARRLQERLAGPPVAWRVYLPLHAPTVAAETTFGRVTFFPGGSVTADRLRREIPDIASAYDVAVVARLSVRAVDSEAARSIAIRQLQQTIDALNFVEPTVEAPYLEPTAAFEAMDAPGESAAVAVHGSRASFSAIRYNVRVRELARVRRTPLERAIDRLLQLEPSRLWRRLLAAAEWAGRANVQRRRDQAFLMKVMALEAALTRDDTRGATTERLRLRVAQVVGGPEASGRKATPKWRTSTVCAVSSCMREMPRRSQTPP